MFVYLSINLDVLITQIQDISQKDHSAFDSLVLFILTHGFDDSKSTSYSMGSRLFSVDMVIFDILVIFDIFHDVNCPTLSGKPKLFFVSIVLRVWTYVQQSTVCIYVCDLNNNRVEVLDVSNNAFLQSLPKFNKPQDIHGYEHKINILDKGNPCLHIYNLDNVLLGMIISHGDSASFQLQAGWVFFVLILCKIFLSPIMLLTK